MSGTSNNTADIDEDSHTGNDRYPRAVGVVFPQFALNYPAASVYSPRAPYDDVV